MPVLIDDFLRMRKEHPVVDVRSEGEFAAGHVRDAVNIPILNNEERKAVGTDFKQKGQKEAIKTGLKLVGPRLLDIIHNTENIAANKEILVHCWRGGMRSNNFCQFAGMAGIKTQSLTGGYKSYRQKALESFKHDFQFSILGGCTGSGKTEVLRALRDLGEQVIDLEALAQHKGSVFGGLMMPPQPTTEQFQNDLFEAIISLDLNRRIWVEDESIAVGRIFLPEDFWRAMSASPVFEMEVTKSVRIERLVREYGLADREQFLEAMSKIVRKLGGQHFQEAKEKLSQDDMPAVIDILLTYYDKAYLIGLGNKKHRIGKTFRWDGMSAEEFGRVLLNTVNA